MQPANHLSVQRAVRRLITDFRDEKPVSFYLFHNIGSKIGNTTLTLAPMSFEEEELAPKGELYCRESCEECYREASDDIEAVCGERRYDIGFHESSSARGDVQGIEAYKTLGT